MYSLYSNQTLSCCNNNDHDNNTTCFFKHYNPLQVQHINQTYVTRRSIGGLGNQLFIIFSTISYAIKYKIPFIFDYTTTASGGARRPTYWHSIYTNLLCYTTKLYPRWRGIAKHLPYYIESEYYYIEIHSPTQLTLNLHSILTA